MRSSLIRTRRTPMGHRNFSALRLTPIGLVAIGIVVLGTITRPPGAQADVITEEDVIRLVRARDADAVAARKAADVTHAQEVAATLYPNPSLGWNREHHPGVDSEDAVFLNLPLDVSGRRAARGGIARARTAIARAAAARTASGAITRALRLFHEARIEERRVEVAAGLVSSLEEAARVVRRRREEGTASGYDEARLVVEMELARSSERGARARAAAIRAELALLLGLDPETLSLPPVTHDRGHEARPMDTDTARRSTRLLHRAAGEAREAIESAETAWLPTLTVTGGWRVRTNGDADHGYMAGLNMTLPVTSRGQDLRAQADAQASYAIASARAAERDARIEITRASTVLDAATAELERFDAATREPLETLERAAASGYREGRTTIVDLIDANKARAQVARRRLELLLERAQAEIALRAAKGEFE